MNRAAFADLIAVGQGITAEFMRSGRVGARAGDGRMHQLDRRDDYLLGATDDGEVVGMAEAAGRSRYG